MGIVEDGTLLLTRKFMMISRRMLENGQLDMRTESTLPPSLRELLENELEQDEKLIWSGQPRVSTVAWRDWKFVLLGIPFMAFTVGWMRAMAQGGGGTSTVAAVFGLPFLIAGLSMLLSPLRLAWLARRTAYAITNRRAIILQNGWSKRVRSVLPGQMYLDRRERGNGWGTIILVKEFSLYAWDRRREIGFWAIPEVKEVESLLHRLAAGNLG